MLFGAMCGGGVGCDFRERSGPREPVSICTAQLTAVEPEVASRPRDSSTTTCLCVIDRTKEKGLYHYVEMRMMIVTKKKL